MESAAPSEELVGRTIGDVPLCIVACSFQGFNG